MDTKQKLLFVSPVYPEATGYGIAMRSYHTLFALAEHFSVDLVVAPWYKQSPASKLDTSLFTNISYIQPGTVTLAIKGVQRRIRTFFTGKFPAELLPELAAITPYRRTQISKLIETEGYDKIHIYRLYNAPLVLPLPDNQKQIQLSLDLDDLDHEYRLQLAEMHRNLGNRALEKQYTDEANHFLELEHTLLPQCFRACVASENDKSVLLKRHPDSKIIVLPNVVELPTQKPSIDTSQHQPRIIFIGTLNYLPNHDGVTFFINEVWKQIKAKFPDCKFIIAGRGMSRKLLKRVNDDESISYLGAVDHVSSIYQQADVAIVPLRLGGGTRIKALEAFAYRIPVVSTRRGVYGIDVEDGQNLLIAETPTDFADACCRLIQDQELAGDLSMRALQAIKITYSLNSLIKQMAQLKENL